MPFVNVVVQIYTESTREEVQQFATGHVPEFQQLLDPVTDPIPPTHPVRESILRSQHRQFFIPEDYDSDTEVHFLSIRVADARDISRIGSGMQETIRVADASAADIPAEPDADSRAADADSHAADADSHAADADCHAAAEPDADAKPCKKRRNR